MYYDIRFMDPDGRKESDYEISDWELAQYNNWRARFQDGSAQRMLAGATGSEVRVYDAESGEQLATYPFEGGFLNDLTATPEAVYVSDSFVPQVAVVPLGEDGALPAPEEAFVLPISGDLEYGEDFNANGIVATDGERIYTANANSDGKPWTLPSGTPER